MSLGGRQSMRGPLPPLFRALDEPRPRIGGDSTFVFLVYDYPICVYEPPLIAPRFIFSAFHVITSATHPAALL